MVHIMIIHLIGSMREFDKDHRALTTIATVIEKSGNTIALNWVAGVYDRKMRGLHVEQILDWAELVEDNTRAIIQADALIVEGSRYNYSQGYQTAVALQHNKPVLNLYRKDSKEYQEWPDKFFVSGVSHPLFTNKAYSSEDELEKIVINFLKQYSRQTHELDIKLSLTNEIYSEIDKLSQKSGKSKAGVVKDIITRELGNN